jgi:hypothetical protein
MVTQLAKSISNLKWPASGGMQRVSCAAARTPGTAVETSFKNNPSSGPDKIM